MDVNSAQILGEAVANKDDTQVQKQPELLVGGLEGDEAASRGVRGSGGVQIARGDAGKGGEVVDDGLGDVDVVVDERGQVGGVGTWRD